MMRRFILCLLCTLLTVSVVAATAAAQTRTRVPSETELTTDAEREVTIPSVTTLQQKGMAMESTIDPRHYFVGPSDVFQVNIWASQPLSFALTVTPEGTLVIPTVGEIPVADRSLAEAKEMTLREIRKRYLSAGSSVTLVSPRPILVTVVGNVVNPGSYTLSAAQRADKAIEEANKLQRGQTAEDLATIVYTLSLRNIRIKHKDATISSVDIPRFRATKDDRYSPYLREGDVVIVPRYDQTRNAIGIYGEVNAPGKFEYVAGDGARGLLEMGFSFTPSAIVDSVELSRLSADGEKMSSQYFNGEKMLAGAIPDIPLHPGDRIIVRGAIERRSDFHVTLVGEFKHPGVYPITKSSTRLTDVVAMAGGFTDDAAIGSAEVSRRSVEQAGIEMERLESLRGGVTPEDSAYYYLETELRLKKEIVNVDFDGLYRQGDSTQNIVLHHNDFISVPSSKKSVYVYGQVVSPGHIPFVPGQGTDYYLRKAGGFTERARGDDIKIVKAKTKQWLSPRETSIEDGDYVWVPKDPERPFSYWMTIIGQTAAIVSVAISLVLLVVQLNQ